MWELRTSDKKAIIGQDIISLQKKLDEIRKDDYNGFVYKIKTLPLHNAIILASIMGSLLSIYDDEKGRSKKAVGVLRCHLQ